MLATFNRPRALVREDIKFLSPDHALVQDAIDLLLESKAGTTAFGALEAAAANLLLEAVFVLEAVADTRWHVEQFLAPTPVRVVVDLGGRDATEEYPAAVVADGCEDGDLHRFLERTEFNAGMLREMVDAAAGGAKEQARALQAEATARAEAALTTDLERLRDLQRLNDHVRPEEIDLAREQLEHTRQAIAHARLRLDAIRLIAAGGEE